LFAPATMRGADSKQPFSHVKQRPIAKGQDYLTVPSGPVNSRSLR